MITQPRAFVDPSLCLRRIHSTDKKWVFQCGRVSTDLQRTCTSAIKNLRWQWSRNHVHLLTPPYVWARFTLPTTNKPFSVGRFRQTSSWPIPMFEQDAQDSLSQQKVAQANLVGFDGPALEPKCTSAITDVRRQWSRNQFQRYQPNCHFFRAYDL